MMRSLRLVILVAPALAVAVAAAATGENHAAGRGYEILTPRSYGAGGPSDRATLTDGNWQGGYWTRANTLAWRLLETQRANVMIDLGETRDIGAVAIGAVHGRSAHPPQVDVYVGADPDSLRRAGGWNAGANLAIAPDSATTALYRSPPLDVSGRYVLFSMGQETGSLVCITELLVHPAEGTVREPGGEALKLREFIQAQDPLRHIPPVSTEIETPHFDWAPALPGGPPRVLTILPYVCSRDAAELEQRVGIDQRVFALLGQTDLMGYFTTQDLLAELDAEPNAIMMGGVGWSQLRPEAQSRLLEVVRNGAGLVWVHPSGLDDAMRDVLAALPATSVPVLDSTLADMPYPLLDDLRQGRWGELHAGPYGKGSITTLSYATPNPNWPTWGSSLFPELAPGTNAPEQFAYWELYCSLLCKLVARAAKGMPATSVESLSASMGPDGAVSVAARLHGEAADCRVRAELRDEFSRSLSQARTAPDALNATLTLAGPFQTGPHLVTVWVTDAAGGVRDWRSALIDVPGPRIVSIEPSAARYERGETVEVIVTCEGLRDGLRLSAELVDGYGGVAARDTLDATDRATVRLDSSLCRSLASRVWVKLLEGDRTVDEKTLLVPTIHDSDLSEYNVGIWATYGSYVAKRHWGYSMVEAQAPLLVDTAIAGTPTAYALYDMRSAPENMHRIYFKDAEQYEQMNLCEPGFRESFLAAVRERVGGAYNWGAYDYSIGDECGYTLRTDEHTLAAFRAWLADKYGAIARLNEAWLSEFTSFEEVSFEYLSASPEGTVAPGLDHRLFSDQLFIDTIAAARTAIEAVDSRNRVGISGTREPAHYIGFDWWKLTNAVTHLAFYDGLQREAIRSFRKPGDMLTSFVGYDSADVNEVAARYFPWLEVFSGFQGISIYSANSGETGGVVRPDLTVTNRARLMTEEVSELKSGIAKALLSAERTRPGIAMLYSQRSIHAAKMLGWPALDNITSISEMIKDIGCQYDFISSEQLEQGVLAQRGYRLIVLPLAPCLSGTEVSALSGFVSSGGSLLAVGPCGVLDANGRLGTGGSLDALFGGKSGAQMPVAPVGGAGSWTTSDLSLAVSAADPELRSTDAARVQPFDEGTPVALLERSTGSGRATMLNFLLSGYRRFQPSGVAGETVDRISADAQAAESYQRLMARQLQAAGIVPSVRLQDVDGRPVRYCEIVEFSAGDIRYVGILPRYFGGRYSQSLAPTSVAEQKTEQASAMLPEIGHLYDVRARRYLGETDRIDMTLTTGIARLYAVLPYRVRGVSVEAPAEARAGRMLSVGVKVEAGNAHVGNHVVHIELTRDGEGAIKPYARNVVTTDGAASVDFPLPLNARTGRWLLRVTDVISGKVETRGINVIGGE